jgi:hypothetical protein
VKSHIRVPIISTPVGLFRRGRNVRVGSKCEMLSPSRCLPLCLRTRTSLDAVGTSHLCQKATLRLDSERGRQLRRVLLRSLRDGRFYLTCQGSADRGQRVVRPKPPINLPWLFVKFLAMKEQDKTLTNENHASVIRL